jgi:predicted transcriptional regulator
MEQQDLVGLVADIVAAHVSNNPVAIGDLPNLIQNIHGALASLDAPPPEPQPETRTPVVSARASVKRDHVVCMVCGARQKLLKRHLGVAHGLTPAAYREEFKLPASYPMVAPAYSEAKRAVAHAIGLGRNSQGRRGRGSAAAKAAPASPTGRRRGRPATEAGPK